MPQKGKLPPGMKAKIVENYLAGRAGSSEITQKYSIHKSTLDDWVRLYQSQGLLGVSPKMQYRHYSIELRLQVVEEYLAGKGSLRQLCETYGISDAKVLRQWIKKYTNHVEIHINSGGSEIYMVRGRTTALEERIAIVEFCIAHGKDYKATIKEYGVSYQQIYAWVRKYEAQGVDGLADRRGKGKDTLTMTEIEKLQAELKLINDIVKVYHFRPV